MENDEVVKDVITQSQYMDLRRNVGGNKDMESGAIFVVNKQTTAEREFENKYNKILETYRNQLFGIGSGYAGEGLGMSSSPLSSGKADKPATLAMLKALEAGKATGGRRKSKSRKSRKSKGRKGRKHTVRR